MTTTQKQTHCKFISIVDDKSTKLKYFEKLYTPIFSNEQIENLNSDVKIHNINTSRYWSINDWPNPVYKNPSSSIYNKNSYHCHFDETTIDLSSFVIPTCTRALNQYEIRKLTKQICLIYNYDKFYTYNLDVHEKLISEHSYVPLKLNKSFIKTNLPRWLSSNDDSSSDFDTWFDNIDLVYWKKVANTFVPENGPFKDTRIFSFMSEHIFNEFEGNIINVNEDDVYELNEEYDLKNDSTDRQKNRQYYNINRSGDSNYNLDTVDQDTCINCNRFGDISFSKEHYITVPNESTDTDFDLTRIDFSKFLLNHFSKKKIKVIKVPSWKTKSNDSKISFCFYTQNQFLKRQTSFAAIVYKHPSYDINMNEVNVNFFSLLSNSSHHEISVKSRVNERIVLLFQTLLWKDGLKLYDPDTADKEINEMYKGLNRYSHLLIENVPQTSLNNLIQLKRSFTPFNKIQNISLTSSPKVDPILESKYKKLHTNFIKHTNALEYDSFSYEKLKHRSDELQRQLGYLIKYKEDLNEEIEKNCDVIKSIYSASEYINKNQGIYDSVSKKYYSEHQESLNNGNYSTDNFFENLAKDNIKLLKITYSTNSLSDQTIDCQSSLEDLKKYSLLKNVNNDILITHVEFLINTPVKIKVDSNNSNLYAGGPYLIKASKNDLYIKLAYNYSLFGRKEHQYCVHPHTSTTNNLENLFNDYSRGCLGEAQALLYNAFKKQDLKLIVLACMTWVTSANSSDMWGRKYNWFLKYKDISIPNATDLPDVLEESNIIEEEEVGDFLQTVFEEEPEQTIVNNLETVENTITPTTGLQNWNPQDFTQPQNNYTPFTQR